MHKTFGLYPIILFAIVFLLPSNIFSQGNLIWASYYGGTLRDRVACIKLDASGNVYIAGKSESATGIATPGAYQTANAGMEDAFIAKFDANGNRLWATYFGGADNDEAFALCLDAGGAVYISGMTFSAAGVASAGAHQTTFGGLVDAFIAKFDVNTGGLIWSTYYGGAAFDEAQAIEADPSGNVYITGSTQSLNGIAFNANQNANAGSADILLAKFNSAGVIQWGTYYGGALAEYGYGISVNANDIYIGGFTRSIGFAVGGFQTVHGGGTNDGFIAKISTATGAPVWSSYYGDVGNDVFMDVQIDNSGDIYFVGITYSAANIATAGAHQSVFGGTNNGDAFIVKMDPAGNRLWATYYGGSNHDEGVSVATDNAGNVYLGGTTYSSNNISFQGYQTNLVGTQNLYVAKFTSGGTRICATYYGKSKDLDGHVAVDNNQNVYLSGTIWNGSTGLALNGFQNTNAGGQCEGLFSKFGPCTNVVTANFNSTTLSGCASLTVNFTNTSVGANSWNWTFGDGNTSSQQNPSNTYANSGQYTVTLIASDGTTNDTQTFVNYITVYSNAQAVSSPSASVLCIGQTVSFTNMSTNAASYSWNFGNGNTSTSATPSTNYNSAGSYTVTLIAINTNGCNDTLTIPIQVKPNSTYTNNKTICTGNNYLLPGGSTVSTAGTYYDTLNSANGCDSIITTNLTVTPALTFSQNISICNGNSFTRPGGGVVNIAGTYKDTISNSNGCDSIITTMLSVVNAITTSQSPSICTGTNYTLPGGNVVNVSGTYIDTLNSSGGCDSIITTLLSVVNFISTSQNFSICNGDSVALPDGSYTFVSGMFLDTLSAIGGCDSIITTQVNLLSSFTSTTNASICNGSSYLLPGGNSVSSAGTYYDTLISKNGCDSVITTVLSITNSINVNQNASICKGNNYTLPGGGVVSLAGNYIDTLTASGGCDSIITTNLSYLPPYTDSVIAQPHCTDSSSTYTLPSGIVVNISGTYIDTLHAKNGCDSIITTLLNFGLFPKPNAGIVPANAVITNGSSITLSQTGGADSCNWISVSNGFTDQFSITVNPGQTTTYCVVIKEIDHGCMDTACVTIKVETPCADINNLAVPNAFSPNNDGVNDQICLQGWDQCLEKFLIKIYDRWGEKVYESTDPLFCWDGTYKGKILDSQVVVFYLSAKFSNREAPVLKEGNISLIK